MGKLTIREYELKERELEIRETLCWLFTKLSLVDYEAMIGDVKEMAAGWQARAGAVAVPREVTCPHCQMPFEVEP